MDIIQSDQPGQSPGVAGVGNRTLPTENDVLNLIWQKYLQNIEPSTPVKLNGFLEYIQRGGRQLLFVDAQKGSLIITVGSGSVKILDALWKDYRTGRVNEMAQKCLVTEEVVNELGITKAKLSTSILVEKYPDESCRRQLSLYSGE